MIWTYPLCELMVINLIPEDKVRISTILNWLLSYFMHFSHILQSGNTEGLSKYIAHMYNIVVYYNKLKLAFFSVSFIMILGISSHLRMNFSAYKLEAAIFVCKTIGTNLSVWHFKKWTFKSKVDAFERNNKFDQREAEKKLIINWSRGSSI